MPRKNYSEGLIEECLSLYNSLEQTGAHKRTGVKQHMATILSYSGKAMYPADVNNMLNILKERELIGTHSIPVLKDGKSSPSMIAALQTQRLLDNIRWHRSGSTITPSVHKVMVIPDIHVGVGLTNERMSWMGRYAADKRPEHIIQIGDWGSWDCFSGHEKPGTIRYAAKPTYSQEFSVFHDSMQKFEAELPKRYKPKKHCAFGNHEERIYIYENSQPLIQGKLSGEVEQVFTSAGWTISPYGARHYVEGVLFTHKQFDTMGKAKSMPAIRRDSLCDSVSGHDHRQLNERVPKDDGYITMVSAGCAMPDGYQPRYAEHALTGWWYGVVMLSIEHGKITDIDFVSMKQLERDYA